MTCAYISSSRSLDHRSGRRAFFVSHVDAAKATVRCEPAFGANNLNDLIIWLPLWVSVSEDLRVKQWFSSPLSVYIRIVPSNYFRRVIRLSDVQITTCQIIVDRCRIYSAKNKSERARKHPCLSRIHKEVHSVFVSSVVMRRSDIARWWRAYRFPNRS